LQQKNVGTGTKSTSVPESEDDAVTLTRHGLLQETTSTTGINTRFGYDALGRQTTIIDPRTGTTTTTYDPDTGRITQVEDPEHRTTTYAYYESDETPVPHYPGGLKSVTNAEGKVAYYDYNAHGQVTKDTRDSYLLCQEDVYRRKKGSYYFLDNYSVRQ
jgi:YD repeat-containing protein